MMIDILLSGLSAYADFSRQGTAIALALIIAFVIVFIDDGKQKDVHKRIAVITIALVIILVLPGLGWVINKLGGYGIGRSPYETVPITLVIGIGAILLAGKWQKREENTDRQLSQKQQKNTHFSKVTIAVILVISMLTILSATVPWQLTASNISFSVNPSKISPATIEIADIITEIEGEDTIAIMPREMAGQVGEYDLGVTVPKIDWTENDESDVINMVHLAAENDCNIVVLRQSDDNESRMAAQAYTLRSRTAGYEIYEKAF